MNQFENPNDRYAASQRQMITFIFLMAAVFLFLQWMRPPQQPRQGNNPAQQTEDDPVNALFNGNETTGDDAVETLDVPVFPGSYVTLGSADPKSPYNMLVTLSSRGATVRQIDMNKPQYRDTQDSTGWMGQIVVELADMPEYGCPVQVVGQGTPAEAAGLQPGDVIVQFNNTDIASFEDLRKALLATKPNQTCKLTVQRAEAEVKLEVRLTQAPLSIVRPETPVTDFESYKNLTGLHAYDAETQPPLSFAMTFERIDSAELPMPLCLRPARDDQDFDSRPARFGQDTPRDTGIENELPGVKLRSDHWKLESVDENEVVFLQYIPKSRLEVRKTYRLEKTANDADPGYALTLKIDIKNTGERERKVAYLLDGPSGLPIQGAWYAAGRKTGPGWSGYGMRDIVYQLHDKPSDVLTCNKIAADKHDKIAVDLATRRKLLDYIGVDTQYFQCTMITDREDLEESNLEYVVPMRVGTFTKAWPVVTNVSFRLVSAEKTLQPEETLSHEYKIFAGPKQPETLEAYGLRDTLYYGWFAWFVKPLLWLLHVFHFFIRSYALAIILLTIVVRLLLYRLNRKQMLSMMRMQEMKPEMEKITEKYKDDMQERSKALQELYRKHNFNPLSGCLPMLIQLPILVALYKALSVDVELYGASLLGSGVRWCSDMAAPDRLWDWSNLWISLGWTSFNNGYNMFALGPYLNVLPVITIILFLVQQSVMMPPPTTDQEKQMRTMMKFMMIFMAFMFFKVPSGLCIYFIASSLWGFAEKRFLPKPKPVSASDGTSPPPAEVTVTDRKYPVRPVDDRESKKKKKHKQSPTNEDEPQGFWQEIKSRWKRVLEEAQHRPGDSQKPGRRRTRKK
ncbi:MAG: YidC/Oxa1 family insertase periplasmic-domain containing protein [Planctomycetaceae bacterium]|nr:YidC/Oxa1 family insertase periplasmic-domain containing protein [Planctomycetaceae bacterium]